MSRENELGAGCWPGVMRAVLGWSAMHPAMPLICLDRQGLVTIRISLRPHSEAKGLLSDRQHQIPRARVGFSDYVLAVNAFH